MTFDPIQQFSDDDPGDLTRLNQLVSNQQWLHDNAVDYQYTAYGQTVTEGLKIAAGVTPIGGVSRKSRARWIGVGSFFTPGCFPVGSATISTLTRTAVWCTIGHRTRNGVVLDHTGLSVVARIPPESGYGLLDGDHRAHWILIGW